MGKRMWTGNTTRSLKCNIIEGTTRRRQARRRTSKKALSKRRRSDYLITHENL
jgi:hypothetical protein